MTNHRLLRFLTSLAIGVVAAMLPTGDAHGQPPVTEVRAQLTPADHAAALSATDLFCHVWPVRPGHGAQRRSLPDCQKHGSVAGAARAADVGSGTGAPFFYPADLINNGGPVVQSAQSYLLFLNSTCTPTSTCWGNPIQFQNDLFASSFIHITDQYVGSTANGRYQTGNFVVNLTGSEPPIMQVSAVQAAVIAGVRALFPNGGGGGYTNVYHLFLPQGQDTCLNSTHCYSPDTPSTFTLCAYHSSMNTTDAIGNPIHVVYTVMPYQNVAGCQVANAPFPNGQLADSTNSVFSHEIIETITDPDGNAWWESAHVLLHGNEIGDLCFAEPQQLALNGNPYDIQLEYNNSVHGCSSAP
jgi:hypothetical protein